MKRYVSPGARVALAVFLGLAAAGAAWRQLDQTRRRMEGRYTMTQVLRARKYIPAGRPVTADAVEVESVPETFRQPTAVTDIAALKRERGQEPFRARVGILKGEQITRSRLYDGRSALGLAWSIPSGKTATSLKLPLERAAGGLLRPGDRVHVYGTRDRSPENSRPRTDLLLPGVRVAAVGDRLWVPDAPMEAAGDEARIEMDGILVTLLVTAREAALLAFAAENGRISLALVSAMDETERLDARIGVSEMTGGTW